MTALSSQSDAIIGRAIAREKAFEGNKVFDRFEYRDQFIGLLVEQSEPIWIEITSFIHFHICFIFSEEFNVE